MLIKPHRDLLDKKGLGVVAYVYGRVKVTFTFFFLAMVTWQVFPVQPRDAGLQVTVAPPSGFAVMVTGGCWIQGRARCTAVDLSKAVCHRSCPAIL